MLTAGEIVLIYVSFCDYIVFTAMHAAWQTVFTCTPNMHSSCTIRFHAWNVYDHPINNILHDSIFLLKELQLLLNSVDWTLLV